MTRSEYASEPIAATVSLRAIYLSVSIPTDQRKIRKGRDRRHSQVCFVFLFWWHRRMLLARGPLYFIFFLVLVIYLLRRYLVKLARLLAQGLSFFPPRLFSLSRMKFHQKSYYSRTRCSSARARPDASHVKAGVTQRLIFSPLLLSVDPPPGIWSPAMKVFGMFLECSRRRCCVRSCWRIFSLPFPGRWDNCARIAHFNRYSVQRRAA